MEIIIRHPAVLEIASVLVEQHGMEAMEFRSVENLELVNEWLSLAFEPNPDSDFDAIDETLDRLLSALAYDLNDRMIELSDSIENRCGFAMANVNVISVRCLDLSGDVIVTLG